MTEDQALQVMITAHKTRHTAYVAVFTKDPYVAETKATEATDNARRPGLSVAVHDRAGGIDAAGAPRKHVGRQDITHRIQIQPMRRDQIGTVGDDRVDIAHHGQPLVQIGM